MLTNGELYSANKNPETGGTAVPLSNDGYITYFHTEIIPNTTNFYSGEFWTGNMNGPGIYSYVTSGRPEGQTDIFIGYVSPSGQQMLVSTVNPANSFVRDNINSEWRRIGVGSNTGGTGEIFNDYVNNFAHSDHAHAEGQKCRAESYNAHAEGYSTRAGHNAHSEGAETKALGQNSHAEGINTNASGNNSHAEGDSTQASNWNAHAEGYRTNAIGNGAHAEGNSDGFNSHNIARGTGSHTEGGGTTAEGDYSHAEGKETVAIRTASHSEGQYNVGIANAIHEVGIGSSSMNKKNAHTILDDGRHYIIGIGGYNGTNIDSAKDLATVINELINK